MTDFYAELEDQLITAGRRRAGVGGLRRATLGRGRPALVVAAVLVTVAVAGALVSTLGLPSGSGSRPASNGAAPPAVVPPSVDPVARDLRGITVAVLNGTTRAGAGRSVAGRLEQRGATIGTIQNSADQTIGESVVAYTDGKEHRARARAVAAVLGRGRVEPFAGRESPPEGNASVIVVVGRDLATP